MAENKKEVKTENKEKSKITVEELCNFCKKEGFVFRSSEIYGGFAGFWDFGPLGVELFNNIKQSWWNYFVHQKDNMTGMDASIISHPRTWKASGHVANFGDLMVYCSKNKKYFRADHIIEDVLKINVEGKSKEEISGIIAKNKEAFKKAGYELGTELKKLSLMFSTNVGPMEDDESRAYLRGETAQGMFMDFKLIQQTSRMKLPFGIAQMGRCFRNEIAPRDFLFRCREFHIAEFEFFINPEEKKSNLLEDRHLNLKVRLLDAETQTAGKDTLKETTIGKMLKENRLEEWHAYWLAEQILWYNSIGLFEIKIREHKKDELSHYSSATFDIDYEYPFGSKELGGIANRGQYDLTQHAKESGEKMEIFDEKYKNKVIPKVIEPTFGLERAFLAVLTKAYSFDEKRQNIVLKIPAKIAPIKASIFPLINQEEHEKLAMQIFNDLKKDFYVSYDGSGSIGRRYARNDESGTPMCITVDSDTPKDKMVTIRDRDTTKQIRVKISELKEVVRKVIEGEDILKLGKVVETRVKE
jgi:glycyl-tRNA synthetase